MTLSMTASFPTTTPPTAFINWGTPGNAEELDGGFCGPIRATRVHSTREDVADVVAIESYVGLMILTPEQAA